MEWSLSPLDVKRRSSSTSRRRTVDAPSRARDSRGRFSRQALFLPRSQRNQANQAALLNAIVHASPSSASPKMCRISSKRASFFCLAPCSAFLIPEKACPSVGQTGTRRLARKGTRLADELVLPLLDPENLRLDLQTKSAPGSARVEGTHRILRHELEDVDLLRLTDSVHSVDGLRLDRTLPPGILRERCVRGETAFPRRTGRVP